MPLHTCVDSSFPSNLPVRLTGNRREIYGNGDCDEKTQRTAESARAGPRSRPPVRSGARLGGRRSGSGGAARARVGGRGRRPDRRRGRRRRGVGAEGDGDPRGRLAGARGSWRRARTARGPLGADSCARAARALFAGAGGRREREAAAAAVVGRAADTYRRRVRAEVLPRLAEAVLAVELEVEEE